MISAVFSPDRKFRYVWQNVWQPDKPLMNMNMLNPSTADENQGDPTVTRCCERARRLDFGGLIVTNAYAFRATLPKDLKKAGFPIGDDNDAYIIAAAKRAKLVVCGWGANIQAARARHLLKLIRVQAKKTPHALIFTKGGQPGHPLYEPYEGCPPMEITDPNFCMQCGFEIAPEMGTAYCGECACEDDGV